MSHTDDPFWAVFGKAVAILSFLFVVACAGAFFYLCYEAAKYDATPVFTVAPDTLPHRK